MKISKVGMVAALAAGLIAASVEARNDHEYSIEWGKGWKWAYLWDDTTGALVRRFSVEEVRDLRTEATRAMILYCAQNPHHPRC